MHKHEDRELSEATTDMIGRTVGTNWPLPPSKGLPATDLPAKDFAANGLLSKESPSRPARAGAAGFTLVELLVVLVILGLLAGIAVPQVMQSLSKAKSSTAAVVVDNLSSALDLYRLDVGRLPTQNEGLEALVERPDNNAKWFGPYLKKRDMIIDPWGNAYHYRFPGEHGTYDIYSLGADNAEGGEDEDRDLGNW